MGEGSGTRPAAQGCRCAAIGGEEASPDRGWELCRCQEDCPRRSWEDSEMRRPMRICAPSRSRLKRDENKKKVADKLKSSYGKRRGRNPSMNRGEKKKKKSRGRCWQDTSGNDKLRVPNALTTVARRTRARTHFHTRTVFFFFHVGCECTHKAP